MTIILLWLLFTNTLSMIYKNNYKLKKKELPCMHRIFLQWLSNSCSFCSNWSLVWYLLCNSFLSCAKLSILFLSVIQPTYRFSFSTPVPLYCLHTSYAITVLDICFISSGTSFLCPLPCLSGFSSCMVHTFNGYVIWTMKKRITFSILHFVFPIL